jgi:NAD(P) transhydrogenase subunit alpha
MVDSNSSSPGSTVGTRTIIGVPKEIAEGETRVSLIPDTVSRLTGDGIGVVVESGAGTGSSISDEEFEAAGATILPDARTVYSQASLVLKVQAPTFAGPDSEIAAMTPGTALVAFLAPLWNHDLVRTLAERGITSFSMDAVPRITRAQSMDAISAMTTISGYKSVLLAANYLPKFFPLLMTAAGTIRPAKVLVIGAGVAGLQAIATARRLGAVVESYDTRPVVKEQVESLGAKFVEIDTGSKDTQDSGGYARQATEEELRKQQEGLNGHIADSDVVITTALVPGRPAPKLIPESAVKAMRTGSVIVDLAAETGGNCDLTVPGEIVVREGVTIIGQLNLPATMPVHASQMYARVMQNLMGLLLKDGTLNVNLEDEIIRGMCITKDGQVIQEMTRKAMNLDEAPASTPMPAAPDPEPPNEAEAAQNDTGGEGEVLRGEAPVGEIAADHGVEPETDEEEPSQGDPVMDESVANDRQS